MADQKQTLFAIVELFGRARIAGAISEQTFGGASMVRVDVPEIRFKEVDYEAERHTNGSRPTVERVIQAHTRSFGPGAIYSINWCDEAAAFAAAHSIKHQPINPFSVREMPSEHVDRLLPLEMAGDDPEDDPHPF